MKLATNMGVPEPLSSKGIIEVNEEHSTITLDLPKATNIFPTFHTSEVMLYIESDLELFPSHKFEEPLPVQTENGDEYYID
jgi:hypothetical protein